MEYGDENPIVRGVFWNFPLISSDLVEEQHYTILIFYCLSELIKLFDEILPMLYI